MTMTPEEKLAMARECVAKSVDKDEVSPRVIAGFMNGEFDEHPAFRVALCAALLAIQATETRMQERVRAETERLQPPADVFDTAFVLQQIGRQATNTDVRQVAAWVLSTAIRETPHAEG